MEIVRFDFFLKQNLIHLIKLHDLLKFFPVCSSEDTSICCFVVPCTLRPAISITRASQACS
jgi:hypothetical protein